VLELPGGATSPVQRRFKGKTAAVAVGSAGNVYVAAMPSIGKDGKLTSPGQVFKLAPDK
jgi:hypothetical protein